MKQENRGGVRTSLTKKIGRPKSEATKVLFVRVPVPIFEDAKKMVYKIINDFKNHG